MTEKEKYVLDHYLITRDGDVYSNWHTKFKGQWTKLHKRVAKDGYLDVNLVCDNYGTRNPFRIHRLVALKYIDNPNNYPVINHKNLDKQDNRAENLEWCSISYNTQHGYDNCAYKSIKKIKITFPNGLIMIFPSESHASRYFGYANPSTIQQIITANRIPRCGKLAGAKLEYTDESVTTIERNPNTATGV